MIKHLTKTGNSFAIVIDRPILEATEIAPTTPLEISTDGDVIIISPVREENRIQRLREGLEKVHERYSSVFRRLA